MKITKTLYVHQVKAWRAWLRKNHRKAGEIWLVYFKKHSGRPRLAYNDAVDEALCFGWIDSTVKTLDGDRYAQRFSPRRKGSACSEMNLARARRMVREKRMTRAGLEALKGLSSKLTPLKPAQDIAGALRRDPAAWRNFKKLPQAYKRIRLAFIEGARKRPREFKRRLGHFVAMTAKGKRFGMVLG
jgi:uncharacterized protein YdeI (YjbR/CyaY-like superfamily)